ncbi:hypothetical protein [Chitinolyticbacter meiyuanensis]|uniref:hypothetical protein n=1 Tax=Chitinolyticbacter meiyuanensis TaxID=682798 RepID=UPI0011E60110|nr:hypothetical protein [Chitinolyticbacter meiyuanensis]
MATRPDPDFDARKAMQFLQESKLIDLSMPVERVVGAVSKLEQVAGYVLAWERYVLVVAKDIEQEVIRE